MSGHAKPREGERVKFTCAKCGGHFTVPDSSAGQQQGGFRSMVRIGGAAWCEACAKARFPRRPARRPLDWKPRPGGGV